MPWNREAEQDFRKLQSPKGIIDLDILASEPNTIRWGVSPTKRSPSEDS